MEQSKNNALNNDVVAFRIKVLEFFEKYNIKTTTDAFKISKTTLYRWRKKYLESNKDPRSLLKQSTKPKNIRKSNTHWMLLEKIRSLRKQYGRLGKEKIKPLLDQFAMEQSLPSISTSTIGKELRRLKLTSHSRVYYSVTGSVKTPRKRKSVKRVRYAPKPQDYGYIEIDTICIFQHGIKRYIFNAIDVRGKVMFAYAYKRSNSRNSTDFLKKLESIFPIKDSIHTIQTDNGSEYLGEFDRYVISKGFKHVFTYPRCPKINGCVERANRTLKEEYIFKHNIFDDLVEFNKHLMKYLVWYNTKRVHKSLGNITPINFILKIPNLSHMYVTHTVGFKPY
jgi:transposase InsO family protein